MRRERLRDLTAALAALAIHAALFVYITASPIRPMFLPQDRRPIDLELVRSKPPPLVPVPVPVPVPAPTPPPTPPPPTPPPPTSPTTPIETTAPPAEHAASPVETAPPSASEPAGSGSLVRLPKGDGAIGKVLGTGGALGPSASALERALDVRADGPMSDGKRASANARRFLETDLADDEVTAGLANDYFRTLKNRVETNWRPAMKQLNDGGKEVTQIGMMKAFVDDDGRAAWDEMWRAYLDLAKQYAQGQKPGLEPARIDRIRELMRSRKGAFRFHAITEAVLTQGPDGKVLTIEMPLTSGHPGIDEGVKDAIETAVRAMADPPPPRVHHGRSFTSTWRLRATWTMVPPTALLTGAGFDITPKGFQIDVPFDITLKTYVMLLRTDAHAQASDAEAPD